MKYLLEYNTFLNEIRGLEKLRLGKIADNPLPYIGILGVLVALKTKIDSHEAKIEKEKEPEKKKKLKEQLVDLKDKYRQKRDKVLNFNKK